MEIKLLPFQDLYLFSNKKFPCLCAGIGTGKTFMFLLKIFTYCEQYPNTTALIVRKEFTDLKDSTMRDFERYFNVKIGTDKDYFLPNKSKIMFRHAAEIEVLKNINLGIAGIEQAEEFETDEPFQFLRDRLRQENGADVRPLCVIANANGHNWVWKYWFNNPPSEEYLGITATTFDNEINLPKDFVADLRNMEKEAPNHFKQYVLNSFEETDQDDYVFTWAELNEAKKLTYGLREGYGLRISGFDVARYGEDKCACVTVQQQGALNWLVTHKEQWEKKDGDYTIGRIQSIVNTIHSEFNIVDEDGLGGPMLDVINAKIDNPDKKYKGFRNPPISYDKNKFYGNHRTECIFKLKDMIVKNWLSGLDDEICEELMTLKFVYQTDGRRILVSKEKMRAEGIKSPNLVDALIMAVSLIGEINYKQLGQNNFNYRQPQYSKECNLFQQAGIR